MKNGIAVGPPLLLPGETVAAHGVAGGGAVSLLHAVDERTVQAGLALLQAAVLLEAAAAAGHTPGILSVAKATFLEGLTGETHRVRGGGGGSGGECSCRGGLECRLLGGLQLKNDVGWRVVSEGRMAGVHLTAAIISLTLPL